MQRPNAKGRKGEAQTAEVDGVKVFSADFVFEQFQATRNRIDYARVMATVAVLVSVTTLFLLIFWR